MLSKRSLSLLALAVETEDAVHTTSTNVGPENRSEPRQVSGHAQKLNWLRAGVLGTNDGIVSVAAVVVGVAGATTQLGPILTAGAAAVIGGAVSMGLGEYVSVSSQKDAEEALVAKEKRELQEDPEGELEELTQLYQEQGLSRDTAERVAVELSEKDALKAHLQMELNIDEDDIVSPWRAAFASMLAFFAGAILPMLTIVLLPPGANIVGTFIATLVALALTGAVGAKLGGSSPVKAGMPWQSCRMTMKLKS
ncbi:VIT1/CCC1 transporter family protein [Pseudoglutamicibacter cumminsii]|uniref:VIT1/CCC1 transporter family protein n=1 Tax=Pseudoglutamicibacter cumminsii TaxID=156979 RepID=UPI003F7FAA87